MKFKVGDKVFNILDNRLSAGTVVSSYPHKIDYGYFIHYYDGMWKGNRHWALEKDLRPVGKLTGTLYGN